MFLWFMPLRFMSSGFRDHHRSFTRMLFGVDGILFLLLQITHPAQVCSARVASLQLLLLFNTVRYRYEFIIIQYLHPNSSTLDGYTRDIPSSKLASKSIFNISTWAPPTTTTTCNTRGPGQQHQQLGYHAMHTFTEESALRAPRAGRPLSRVPWPRVPPLPPSWGQQASP